MGAKTKKNRRSTQIYADRVAIRGALPGFTALPAFSAFSAFVGMGGIA